MIRVLHLVCFSELYGTQRSILSTIKCLEKEYFEVFLAAPASEDFSRLAVSAGAAFFPVPMTGLADFRSIAAIRKIIRAEKIGIIHCHLGISSFLGLAAASLCGIPAVVSRHFVRDRYVSIENRALRALYLAIYKGMDRRFKKIICVSSAVRDAIVARESAPLEKCSVIYNGTDVERYRSGIAKSFNGDGERTILCVSRLVPEKGIETLLNAFSICLREGSCGKPRLVIAGSGPLRQSLEHLSESLGIAGSVRFTGFVPDISPLLGEADVFVLPAIEEPFGIALIEAMAAGIPSVATAAGGPLEIITHGSDGLLAPPGDAPALAAALCELLSSRSRLEAFSKAARINAERFDEYRIANELQEVYYHVLGDINPGTAK